MLYGIHFLIEYVLCSISVKVPEYRYHSLSLMDDRDHANYRSRRGLDKAEYGGGVRLMAFQN
jgi:hypothetical protein